MHDNGVGRQCGEACGGEAILRVVGAGRREETTACARHALALHAQHHDRVGLGRQGLIEVVGGVAVPGLHPDRQECRGRDEGDTGTQERQEIDVGARHA